MIAAAIRGMSKILMKQRNMVLEMSFFESGRGLRISTIFEDTNDVDICSPIKTIKKSTMARKAETPP